LYAPEKPANEIPQGQRQHRPMHQTQSTLRAHAGSGNSLDVSRVHLQFLAQHGREQAEIAQSISKAFVLTVKGKI
jgi:hypothetical protein